MAKSLAMMPWFPSDFLSATRGWSVTAKGVYRELLDAQWELGSLPVDPEELRGTIGASEQEWGIGWAKCASKFALVEGTLKNLRLEEHREKALRLSQTRRSIGQRGGQASAQARTEAIASPNGQPIAQAKVNHPSPSPSEDIKNSVRAGPEDPPTSISRSDEPDPAQSPTIDAAIFAEARRIFGSSIGGQLNRAIRAKGKPWVLDVIERCRGKDPEAARAYLSAALNRSAGGGHDRVVV